MKKLSAVQKKALADALDTIEGARNDLNEVVDEYNAAVEALPDLVESVGNVEDAVEAYNGLLEEYADAAECWYDERSERWQEGERGEAYAAWFGALAESVVEWEGPEPSDVWTLDEADEPDVPEVPTSPDEA